MVVVCGYIVDTTFVVVVCGYFVHTNYLLWWLYVVILFILTICCGDCMWLFCSY